MTANGSLDDDALSCKEDSDADILHAMMGL
jgi:hypothetical protein